LRRGILAPSASSSARGGGTGPEGGGGARVLPSRRSPKSRQNLPWRPRPEAKRWAPAMLSPVLNVAAPIRYSRRRAAGRRAPSDSWAERRSLRTLCGGKAAIVAARASASWRAWPRATIRLARPIAEASRASTGRPVRIRSSARPSPISAGTKGAVGAPEHGDTRLAVALEGVESGGQRGAGGPVDRIAPVRPVEDDGGDGALRFGPDARSFHGWYTPPENERAIEAKWLRIYADTAHGRTISLTCRRGLSYQEVSR